MATRTLKDMLNSVLSRSAFVTETAFVGGDIDSVQMVEFANMANVEFRRFFPWPRLRKTGTATMTGAASYALATDFDYLVPETMYQTGAYLPVTIPASDELWGYLTANSTASSRAYIGKIIGGALVVAQETAGDVITYEYISKHAVQATGGGATKERFTVDTDVFLLDEETLIMGITGYWQLQKEIQSGSAMLQLFRKKMREYIAVDVGAKNIRPVRTAIRGPISSDYLV